MGSQKFRVHVANTTAFHSGQPTRVRNQRLLCLVSIIKRGSAYAVVDIARPEARFYGA